MLGGTERATDRIRKKRGCADLLTGTERGAGSSLI